MHILSIMDTEYIAGLHCHTLEALVPNLLIRMDAAAVNYPSAS